MIRHRSLACCALVVAAALTLVAGTASAAPRLYTKPFYQSPVRGGPDDLLLLAGDGLSAEDVVVYLALNDTTIAPLPPAEVPATSTAGQGVAAVVSIANVPHALTVRLPATVDASRSYALWVRSPRGEWSAPVRINDARPLWITPAVVYASAPLANGLPRQIKVVGRNLAPSDGAVTQVRLSGPSSLTLASAAQKSDVALQRHSAVIPLPPKLAPGDYRVQLSRDGRSWVSLDGQRLQVLPDPAPPASFAVTNPQFGGCRPDDGEDDTACVQRAVAAAAAAGGGMVDFAAGEWDLGDRSVGEEGIVLPAGVRLHGAGPQHTRLLRREIWGKSPTTPLFTLLGRNAVEDLEFKDAQVYQAGEPRRPTLQLGRQFFRVAAAGSVAGSPDAVVEDVVIGGNRFVGSHPAVADGGLPIRRLLVVHNEFGAFDEALALSGNLYNMDYKFRLDDSVIAYNAFRPGSFIDPASAQGPIASEIGAASRLDFSDNFADGSATRFLYRLGDARGWRAAFFWNLNNNQEMMLVSHNTVTCSGDRIGDGEAFSYDDNTNTTAFDDARPVLAAGSGSVTVSGNLVARHNDRDVHLADYYTGHWIAIVQGTGVGQARRVRGYTADPASGQVRFEVEPAWDVPPVAGQGLVVVTREYWQVYTLANRVDQRQPLCQKSNRSQSRGGVITVWAQSADSVIEGNRQFDTDGIAFQQTYNAGGPADCPECRPQTQFQSFLDIRGNLVDGEYDWEAACSWSGIMGWFGAAPVGTAPLLPTASFGVSISHNMIRHADGLHSGAISVAQTWQAGPPPHDWPLVDNLLIFANDIADIDGPPAKKPCAAETIHRRAGIQVDASQLIWRTVLYHNACKRVAMSLADGAKQTQRLCEAPGPDDCECAGAAVSTP